jgi:glycosyltransferase involved in cell wall biosynthesis
MSDSMYSDKPRVFWVEAVKRRVVRCFASAVVGSAAQREYLSCLGMRLDQTVLGYNVIDNSYFSAGAAAARQDADAVRNALKLPQDYFLASGRFIPVKNLFGLLSEYALYLQSPADKKAKLAIIGDGPLRHALTERIQELNLAGHVFLLGKKTYAELPALYALARAFVLASTKETWGLVVNEAMASGLPVIVSDRCGCAPHLVSPGVNGFIFSPSKRGDLAARLADLSKDSAAVARMGQQSQAIIASWSPELFATALEEAFRLALSEPRFRGGWADRLLLSALSRRKEGEPE